MCNSTKSGPEMVADYKTCLAALFPGGRSQHAFLLCGCKAHPKVKVKIPAMKNGIFYLSSKIPELRNKS
jgi:hypothetical protein